MEKLSNEQLMKLRDYLISNAKRLANEGKISELPYYPGRNEMRDYTWTIIDVAGFGKIEMYFTGDSSIVKINSVRFDANLVRELNFYDAETAI